MNELIRALMRAFITELMRAHITFAFISFDRSIFRMRIRRVNFSIEPQVLRRIHRRVN